MIYHDKFSSQQTLAKHLRIAPATLSVRIQRLEGAGYLRREVDENDKRNYILKLEPKGKELVALTHQATDKIVKEIFDDFSDEEMQQLIYYINKLKNNVRNMKEEI
jgi:DNA-binding MarR family transcriptional regulator